MKKYLSLLCLVCAMLGTAIGVKAQTTQLTNHYAMKLIEDGQGGYKLLQEARYAKARMDMSKLTDVLVPYKYEPQRLTSKLYKGVETVDIVYKKANGYELILSVDKAVSDKPAPFMIYLHGGGWRTSNNGSSKVLSQYLAKQAGITGVRVSYTLATQLGATIQVTIQDVMDALKYVQNHAKELHVDPSCFGFLGTSAGAHLAAVGAMKSQAKLLVGYSGIYDLQKAKITAKTKDAQRIAYFAQLNPKTLAAVSPINLIPQKNIPACLLVCGTYDLTVDCEQSKMLADAVKQKGGEAVLSVYPFYDHNLSSKGSDKMEEIFFKSADFIQKNLK